jgi:hypothetical protein
MNCQRFEGLVNDVAREQIMDAALQHEALRHTGKCAACAARLNDERALTHQLRVVASTAKSISASEKVEARLLAAFDAQSFVSTQPIRLASETRYWLAAIAAVLLIVSGLFVTRFWPAGSSQPASIVKVGETPANVRQEPSEAVQHQSPSEEKIQNRLASAGSTRSIRDRKERVWLPAASFRAPKLLNTEITTDFFPVNYGGAANLDAGGQIVRVELPRTTMASFGLPVNMERADEKIKADVLLGVDGLAHAIRFVGNRTSLDLPK